MAEPPLVDPAGYAYFVHEVAEVLGFDLRLYRATVLRQELEGFLTQHPDETYFSLAWRLRRDTGFAHQVRNRITTHVSEFFRNPELFHRLEQEILPSLDRGIPLRIWSAACSVGAEPYSLAMLLLERDGMTGSIWATDIDEAVLAKAASGHYRPAEVRGVPPARLVRHFEPTADGFAVRRPLRALVQFERHDLLTDPFPSAWDLILCRNVVIYFTEPAQRQLYRRLAAALRPGGVLFVGAAEAILAPESFGLVPVAPAFYRRPL
jgi:chemotaxis protein methyltransferase CheR